MPEYNPEAAARIVLVGGSYRSEARMKRLTLGLSALLSLSALQAARPAAPPPRVDPTPVVRGNTHFACDLYARLRSREGNLFFSPFSISTALAMTSGGAGGSTLSQMRNTLRLPEQWQLHPANGLLLHQLNDPERNKGYTLSTANALWGQKGHPFRTEFLDLNRDCYHAGLREVDFGKDTEGARKTINGWVEKQTQGKIKDLLKKDVLTSSTRLVLTNAIYFKGNWASQFKKDRTREGKFLAPGKPVDGVPFMSQTGRFPVYEERGMQVVELPFVGNDLSMVFFVPTRKDALAELEKTLTPERLAGYLAKLQPERVEVILPRFQLSAEFGLRAVLSDLGMPDAFDRSRADFSGINGGKEPLFLSAVVHKAFLDVNEKGAEATGATGVVVEPRSIPSSIRADRPFLFLIRDKKTESVLFLGRLVNPRR